MLPTRMALRSIDNLQTINHGQTQCTKLCVDVDPSQGYVLQYLQPTIDKFITGDEKVCIIGFGAFEVLLGQSIKDPGMATIVHDYLRVQRRVVRLNVQERCGAKMIVKASRVCRSATSQTVFVQCLKDLQVARKQGKDSMLTFSFEAPSKHGRLCFMDLAQPSALDGELGRLECLDGAHIAVVGM